MPNELARLDVVQEQQVALEAKERAGEILTQLRGLKSNLVVTALQMGDLLLEVKQNNYHIVSGYPDFESWLDDSEIDMRISQAYYMMRIVSKANAVGIERSKLEQCNITALKEIASFNPDTQANEIRDLVEYASEHRKNKEVISKVNEIKVANGQEIYTLKGYRVSQLTWDNVINPALEQIKLEYGQTINAETGEIEEISDGRAYELLAAEYMNGR